MAQFDQGLYYYNNKCICFLLENIYNNTFLCYIILLQKTSSIASSKENSYMRKGVSNHCSNNKGAAQ